MVSFTIQLPKGKELCETLGCSAYGGDESPNVLAGVEPFHFDIRIWKLALKTKHTSMEDTFAAETDENLCGLFLMQASTLFCVYD